MNEIIQTLQGCGLRVKPGSTPVEVTSVLMKADNANLRKAFDQLCGDDAIGFRAEGSVQNATLAYALAYAVENDLSCIDQEMIDNALIKARSLFEVVERKTHTESKATKSPKKRTRSPHLRDEMTQHIKDNPDHTKQVVVDLFLKRYPDKAVNTLAQYYHSCRKDAGLKPNGKPGRKSSNTFDLVCDIVSDFTADNPDATVSDLKEAVLKHPDIKLSPPSAQVYVYRARSELNQKGE